MLDCDCCGAPASHDGNAPKEPSVAGKAGREGRLSSQESRQRDFEQAASAVMSVDPSGGKTTDNRIGEQGLDAEFLPETAAARASRARPAPSRLGDRAEARHNQHDRLRPDGVRKHPASSVP